MAVVFCSWSRPAFFASGWLWVTIRLLGYLYAFAVNKRYNIKSLGVFGSYVHNKQKKRSDLDILVEFKTAPTFFQLIQLEDQLSQIVGTKVDLVMQSALKPRIGEQILSEVIML